MRVSKKLFKSFGFIGIVLCAACCALPIVGLMFGAGSLAVLSRYFEWAGITALVVALVSFVFYFFKRQKAPSCDIDCGCKPENDLTGQVKK